MIDMGAGTGALSLEAAKAGARVLAVDIAPGMVARLNERLAEFPGNEARVMDGAALDLAENTFDAGFSVFAATCMPAWQQMLSELTRVVKKGGRVTVTHWSDPTGFAGPSKILVEFSAKSFRTVRLLRYRAFTPPRACARTWRTQDAKKCVSRRPRLSPLGRSPIAWSKSSSPSFAFYRLMLP
jgi:ubiquinone/menaquinone biosynthesis C-methylase UbiE